MTSSENTDQLQQRVEAAERRLRDLSLQGALRASGLDQQAAARTAKLVEGIEFDENANPTNLAEAVARAREEYGDAIPTPESVDFHRGPREPSDPGGEGLTGWSFPGQDHRPGGLG